MTRQAKTPKQRAQEQLDVAERLVKKLTKQRDRLGTSLEQVSRERDQTILRRDHLKKHPDLAELAAVPGDTATTGATATPRTTSTGGTTR